MKHMYWQNVSGMMYCCSSSSQKKRWFLIIIFFCYRENEKKIEIAIIDVENEVVKDSLVFVLEQMVQVMAYNRDFLVLNNLQDSCFYVYKIEIEKVILILPPSTSPVIFNLITSHFINLKEKSKFIPYYKKETDDASRPKMCCCYFDECNMIIAERKAGAANCIEIQYLELIEGLKKKEKMMQSAKTALFKLNEIKISNSISIEFGLTCLDKYLVVLEDRFIYYIDPLVDMIIDKNKVMDNEEETSDDVSTNSETEHEHLLYPLIMIPNTNDSIIRQRNCLYYIHLDGRTKKYLDKFKLKQYQTEKFCTRLQNTAYLLVSDTVPYSELASVEIYKLESIIKTKRMSRPFLVVNKTVYLETNSILIDKNHLIIGSVEKELIVYKLSNFKSQLASIQLNGSIHDIVSSENYISIKISGCDGLLPSLNSSQLLTFKII